MVMEAAVRITREWKYDVSVVRLLLLSRCAFALTVPQIIVWSRRESACFRRLGMLVLGCTVVCTLSNNRHPAGSEALSKRAFVSRAGGR